MYLEYHTCQVDSMSTIYGRWKNNLYDLSKIERVLVLGAHFDDEIIGPGATCYKLAQSGAKVCVVSYAVNGGDANSLAQAAERTDQRWEEAKKSSHILMYVPVDENELRNPDPDILKAGRLTLNMGNDERSIDTQNGFDATVKIIRQYQPSLVFAHYDDEHPAHKGVYRIAEKAVRKAALSPSRIKDWGEPWAVPEVWAYEISRSIAEPHVYVAFGRDALEAKLEAMRSQKTQERDYPMPSGRSYLENWLRKIEGRAMERGADIGREYAEAFYKISDMPAVIDFSG